MKPLSGLANGVASRCLMMRCAGFKGRGLRGDVFGGWFARVNPSHHKAARRFLFAVRYFSANAIHDSLVRACNRVMDRLADDGVSPSQILVVQVDTVGSSAAKAVAIFRRNARYGKQCHYCQATDTADMIRLAATYKIRVVVYVDDYIGTGTQVQTARNCVTAAIGAVVAEHVISVIILEEAKGLLDRQCSVRHDFVHLRSQRPMLCDCKMISSESREALIDASLHVGAGCALGFGGCASMVVLSDDVPDNSPALLREALFEHL